MCIFFIDNLIKLLDSLPLGGLFEQAHKTLQMIRCQLLLMECFVEDLLSYNMIQSGNFTLKPVDFDVDKVIDFIQFTFQEKFLQKNLQLSVKFVDKLESSLSLTEDNLNARSKRMKRVPRL